MDRGRGLRLPVTVRLTVRGDEDVTSTPAAVGVPWLDDLGRFHFLQGTQNM